MGFEDEIGGQAPSYFELVRLISYLLQLCMYNTYVECREQPDVISTEELTTDD